MYACSTLLCPHKSILLCFCSAAPYLCWCLFCFCSHFFFLLLYSLRWNMHCRNLLMKSVKISISFVTNANSFELFLLVCCMVDDAYSICSWCSLPNGFLTNDKVQDELYHTSLIQPHLNHRRLSVLAIQATVMVIQPQILCGYSIGFQFGEFCTPNLDHSITRIAMIRFRLLVATYCWRCKKSNGFGMPKVGESLNYTGTNSHWAHIHIDITIYKHTNRTEMLVWLKWERIQMCAAGAERGESWRAKEQGTVNGWRVRIWFTRLAFPFIR